MEIISLTQLLRFGAALVFVLALMGGLGLVMKRINHGSYKMPARPKRRLKIKETLSLDARRRLLLIQRDEREHLVILGPNGETVIETGIESVAEQEAEAETEENGEHEEKTNH